MIAIIIIITISLLGMLFQDLKYRKIHILFPIAVFIAGSISQYYKASNNYYYSTLLNVLLFMCIFTFLVAYMSIKQRRFLNPFQHYFGLGDFLFYMSITPFFTLTNYLIFFIASMVFAIVCYYALKHVFISESSSIPLAGFSSLLLLCLLGSAVLFDHKLLTIV